MKKNLFLSAIALLSVFTLSMTSCSKDDDPAESKIEFKNAEFGHHNKKTATIGKDIHLECEIVSASKIKSISATLKDKAGKTVATQTYTDSKYVGVLNTKFHEHLKLAADLKPGIYHCVIAVSNEGGTTKTLEADVTLIEETVTALKVSHLKASSMEGVAGSKLRFTADIESPAAIAEIEIEFHGGDEYPVKAEEGYKGKSGKIAFDKEITIPTACKPGKYHIHFTVKDVDGKEVEEEIEGFTIK